jgi:hypothetical protein
MHPVLAPVCLISDHYDVLPVREEGIDLLVLILGEELLNGGKDDTTGGYTEQCLQMIPALCLDGGLPEEFSAPGEGSEELIVKVIPVGDDQDRRVLE